MLYKFKLLFAIALVLSSITPDDLLAQTESGFMVVDIDQKVEDEMRAKNVFGKHSPIPLERLKLVYIKHVDFNGNEQYGKIIVMDACAEQVKQLFLELYEARFPMTQVKLITEYNGSDSLSMAENNTSAHNLRQVTGGKRLSLHAYGTAIDINPINNPYIDIPCNSSQGIARFEPVAGIKYANRMENRLGKKNRSGMAEQAIDIFARNGFYWWGGYWNCPIDYQHFQISRTITELLAVMTSEEAKAFFIKTQLYYNTKNEPIEYALEELFGDVALKDAYLNNSEMFLDKVSRIGD